MKKSLLLGLVALASLTASAVSVGDKVYTPKARYQISDETNLCSNGTFVGGDLTGWTAITADGTEAAAADMFTYAAADDFGPAGIQSVSNAVKQGISYSTSKLLTGHSYVLSMTITDPNTKTQGYNFNTRLADTFDNATYTGSVQMLNIIGTDGEGNTVEYGFPAEILPGSQTYSWAIPASDTQMTYEFKFIGWDTSLRISNVEIHEANQIVDDRTVVPVINYAKAVRDMYEWDGDLINDLNENINAVAEMLETEGTTPDEMEGALTDLQGFLTDFFKDNADDYLPNALDKLPKAASKVSKQGAIGNWKDDANRIHSNANDYYDLGHFQYSAGWGNASSGGRIGLVYYGIDLVPGTYIFSVDLKGNCREFVKNAWGINEGLEFADAILTVNNAADPENKVEVATTGRYALAPQRFTKNQLVFKVEEAGKFDIRIDTYAKGAYDGVKSGSVVFPFGASLYGVTGSKYSKAQLDYEQDVLGQVKAGRDNLTAATEFIADEAKSWGKAALQEVVDQYESVIADYEAKTQDEIIETYDETIYDASKGLEATTQDGDYYRLMASEVYINATKTIIAAVNEFKSENAVIDGLTAAIEAANKTLNTRLYGGATGKADFQEAIAGAVETEKILRADDYSEDNKIIVEAAIADLAAASDEFKQTIPAQSFKTIVDIDFNNEITLNETTAKFEAVGAAGKMVLPSYKPIEEGNSTDFSKGYLISEEPSLMNLLRVGNGQATVDFASVADDDKILMASFDMYFGSLTTKYAGFRLQNEIPAEVEGDASTFNDVCGLIISKYDGKANLNTFDVDFNANITSVGSSTASNDAIAAESNKTHFDVIMDMGTKKMYLTYSGAKGSFTTQEIAFEEVPSRFVLQSDYNNQDRRCWFSNLKIQTITVGTDAVQGVAEVNAAAPAVIKMAKNGVVLIKSANGTFTAAGAQVK